LMNCKEIVLGRFACEQQWAALKNRGYCLTEVP
jgi:hypothetical protein